MSVNPSGSAKQAPSPGTLAAAHRFGATLVGIFLKLAILLLGVSLTGGALQAGWGIAFPIFPAWGLTVLGLLGLGYISRVISYAWYEGSYNFTLKKILDFQANGAVRIPGLPEMPGTVFPNPQAGPDGRYL